MKMKNAKLFPLLLPLLPLVYAQVPGLPSDFVAAVVECNCTATGVPSVNGGAGFGHLLSAAQGLYSYTVYDISFTRNTEAVRIPPVLMQTTMRTGVALWVRSIGRLQIFADGGAGIAATGANVGGSFAGGGFGVLPLGKGWGLIGGGWVTKSTIADQQNKTATVAAFGTVYSWER